MKKSVKSFDGLNINYDIFKIKGKKKFLVFIHGLGGDLACWNKERNFFHKKGIPTIAIDLRGHGMSERPKSTKGYNLENFAKDIYAVIKKEKISNFILIGHCFGGMITILFHKLYPKLAKSYILISTTAKPQKILKSFLNGNEFIIELLTESLNFEILRKESSSPRNYKEFIGKGDWNIYRISSDIKNTSLRSWLLTLKNVSEFDGIKIIKSIKKKVLIIEGKEDSVFNVDKAKKMNKLIKNSELVIIPHANHIIELNNPKSVEKEILKFIKLN